MHLMKKGSVIMNKNDGSTHVISRVAKDNQGEITAYELETGEIVSKEQAVLLVKQGSIGGVSVSTSKKGEEFLRSLPDQNKANNLDSLPVIDDNDIY
jgi:hypothetical protein